MLLEQNTNRGVPATKRFGSAPNVTNRPTVEVMLRLKFGFDLRNAVRSLTRTLPIGAGVKVEVKVVHSC